MQNSSQSRITLVLTTSSFLLISLALVAVLQRPVESYELSLYVATPAIFWIAIAFGLLNGIYLIFSNIGSSSRFAYLGIFEILFCNFLLLCIYALRGYTYIERGDALTYIGYAKEIANTHHFFDNNIYPTTSLLIAQVNQVANLDPVFIAQYLPGMFFVFYMVTVFLLAKTILHDRTFAYMAFFASTPIFFAWFSPTILHMSLAVLTIPFILYLIHRCGDWRFLLLGIIWILLCPFFHPITVVFTLTYFGVYLVYRFSMRGSDGNMSPMLFTLGLVVAVTWFLSQLKIRENIQVLAEHLLFVDTVEQSSTAIEAISFIDKLGGYDAIKSIILMASDELMFYALSSLAFLYLVILLRKQGGSSPLMPIGLCFVCGSVLLAGVSLLSSVHTPYRLINLNPNMVLCPLLVGFILHACMKLKKRFPLFLVAGVVLFVTFTAMISLYPSPITSLPNPQISSHDVSGMDWLIVNKDEGIDVVSEKMVVFRYGDLIYGSDIRLSRDDLWRTDPVPNHFGFTSGNIYPIQRSSYLVLSTYIVRAHIDVWVSAGAFDAGDFARLELCENVIRIYDNSDFVSYYITGNDMVQGPGFLA